MGSVHFKLSMSDGLTRRISFPTRPSWTDLATRIHSFCNIPRNRLAVSYVDSDGDEVTLSSEEELRDFYESNADDAIQGNQLIRFRVVELGSLRDADNFMEPISPQQSSTRNTFGRPTPFVFVDHDHLPFGDLYIPSPLDHEVDSPHAFVEVVSEDGEKEISDLANHSPSEDRGKARDLRASVSEDVSSSKSVIADETPTKPPIHVQVHGLRPMDSGTFGPPATSTPARESVTPTPRSVPSRESHEEAQRDLPGSYPDPPTPELDAHIDPSVSLSNDLASLLDSLNSMFHEHPEVGFHLRGLFGNVGNGSYWNVQPDSMARVAEDLQRVARDAQSAVAMGAQEMARNVRQRAQHEAARRVTESVGNILRAFGASGNESNANAPSSTQVTSSTNVGPPPQPAAAGSAPFWNQFKPFAGLSPGPQRVDPSSSSSGTHPPEVSYYAASASREARPNTSEIKASLEAAKANYKAEKERYRQEQEARRRERWLAKDSAANSPLSPAQPVDGHTFNPMAPSDAEASRRLYPNSTAPPPLRQIISNARGRFPQLEMVNMPRTPVKQRGEDKMQHVDTVVERLEVMGFNEATHPTMRTVVESHLPTDGTRITKENEDEVMSEVLEKLLDTSGSGMHATSSSN